MNGSNEEYELERLRAELAQEKQTNDMLEQSLGELQLTVDELEKRIEGLDDESSEWKTRYETQVEMNQQLHLQALILAEKIEEAKRNLKDSKQPKTMRMFDDGAEITPNYVKTLEKSKAIFENQLRDLEWRLDQESKAYHKANEERKNYVLEINATKGTIESMKSKQRAAGIYANYDNDNTPRVGNSNIPQDQRILDPRKGPIRKTAAVKSLPRLDS